MSDTVTLFRCHAGDGMWHVLKEEREGNKAHPLCIQECNFPFAIGEKKTIPFPESVNVPSAYYEWRKENDLLRRGNFCKACQSWLYQTRVPRPAYDPARARAVAIGRVSDRTAEALTRVSRTQSDKWRSKHITRDQENFLIRHGCERVEVETWTMGKASDEINRIQAEKAKKMEAQNAS